MFTSLYSRLLSANWKLLAAAFLLILVITAVVASNLHALPSETLVAVNWEEKASGPDKDWGDKGNGPGK